MTMHTIHGDIWSQTRGVLVHGCNAQGKMGAGAALGFKKKFPQAFAQYEQAWRDGKLQLGEVIFCELGPDLWGACAITQKFYGNYGATRVHADLGAIQAAFEKVAQFASAKNLPVAFIRVGAGLAGGDWGQIEPIIQKALGPAGGTLVEFAAAPTIAKGAAALSGSQSAAPAPEAPKGGSFKWGQKRG